MVRLIKERLGIPGLEENAELELAAPYHSRVEISRATSRRTWRAVAGRAMADDDSREDRCPLSTRVHRGP